VLLRDLRIELDDCEELRCTVTCACSVQAHLTLMTLAGSEREYAAKKKVGWFYLITLRANILQACISLVHRHVQY